VKTLATITIDPSYTAFACSVLLGRSRLSLPPNTVALHDPYRPRKGCAYHAEFFSLILIRGAGEREGNEADVWRSWRKPTLFSRHTHYRAQPDRNWGLIGNQRSLSKQGRAAALKPYQEGGKVLPPCSAPTPLLSHNVKSHQFISTIRHQNR
jgi:hypothetical protein